MFDTPEFRLSRRTWLGLGLSAVVGPLTGTLAQPLAIEKKPARSCILIWLGGGASHIDTFDPKPDAESGVKGEFGTIDTSIPGVRLSEVLPGIARVLDRSVLVRSLTSPEADHDRASHHILTGWRPNPALTYPSLGSVYARIRGGLTGNLPNHVAIPTKPFFGGSGYLTSACDPLDVPGDPNDANFRIRDLAPPDKVTFDRMLRRKSMVERLNQWSRAGESEETRARADFDRQTYQLLTSPAAQNAFRVQEESGSIRDRYGRNALGQSMLLARRLIEQRVGYVTVNDRGGGLSWDTHVQNFQSLKDRLVPPLDQGLSALIDDLDSRGLLDETLVVVCGEFGRTPKINPQAGRDHHGRAASVLLAGCGLKRGVVLGKTDRNADSVVDRPVTPAELCATILKVLEIDPETRFRSPDGRPIPLVDHASAVAEIIA
jgi:hypothetical protein